MEILAVPLAKLGFNNHWMHIKWKININTFVNFIIDYYFVRQKLTVVKFKVAILICTNLIWDFLYFFLDQKIKVLYNIKNIVKIC